MENIDWDKAPEWADRVVRIGIAQNIAWACDEKYKYLSGDGPFLFFDDPTDGFMLCQTVLVESRPRPSPAWDGEGLPPVGVVCEYFDNQGKWHRAVMSHIGSHLFIVKYQHPEKGEQEACMYISGFDGHISSRLRPIRTPEQVAAEEREAAVKDACADISNTIQAIAGYVPVDRAAEKVVRAMIEAGYRKP